MTEQQREIDEYTASDVEFRSFYFSLGTSAETTDEIYGNTRVEPVDVNEVISDGVRKLFKLERALNVPRGAPGRLSTAYGSLASAVDQWNSARRAEGRRSKQQHNALKEKRHERKLNNENYFWLIY